MDMVHSSLFDVVEQHARDTPNTVAAIDAIAIASGSNAIDGVPTTLTYSQLCEGAKKLSIVLAEALETTVDGAWLSWQDGSRSSPPLLATWMRRGSGWYLFFCAANRLQVPVVALSNDLPDKATEAKRNAEIIGDHSISLLVVDSCWDGSTLQTIHFNELLARTTNSFNTLPSLRQAGLDATFCFNYTGGTTKASRCAKISTRMALHEIGQYPKIVCMRREDRVLQQHSLYWGASAYGEIDVALAFGCALVFAEAWDTDGVATAIRQYGITCAGLVPSVLAAMEPSDLPSLRLVFTWGEALQARVARQWAQKVHLIDLLISTECWLSLYADWSQHVYASRAGCDIDTGSPPFKAVAGAMVELRPMGGTQGASCAGELIISGPMVSSGYTSEAFNGSSFHVDDMGRRWFCTKDCLEPCGECGFKFAGRADDLVKIGGVWVDINELEQRVAVVDGVSEVCICSRDVFVVMKSVEEGSIQALRKKVPVDFVPYVVERLPRHPATGKVNRQLLMQLVSTSLTADYEKDETQRCVTELSSILRWCKSFLVLLLFSTTWSIYAFGGSSPTEVRSLFDILMSANALFMNILVDFTLRLVSLSYILLSVWYFNEYAYEWMKQCARFYPGGCYSMAICVVALVPYQSWICVFAAPGMLLAMRRSRFLSWPMVALVGFPVWLRGSSEWMGNKGFRGTLSWYWSKVPSLKWLKPRAKELLTKIQCRLGFVEKCRWCKVYKPSSTGRKDPTIDPHWYCDKCWQHFHSHKQCTRCKDWAVHGKMLDQGTGEASWICWHCERGHSNSDKGRSKSVSQNTSHMKPVRTLTITRAAPCGKKRSAPENEGVERNCCMRLRTSENYTNGCLAKSRCEQEGDEKTLADTNHVLEDIVKQVLQESIEKVQLPAQQKSREWALVERATGVTFSTESESLLGLDSLHHAKLTSALRRQAGKKLTREALKRCSTLKDLLLEIERIPVERSSADVLENERKRKPERATWGMMWNSKCQWVFHRNRPASEATVRNALQKLVERHEALRTKLQDPFPLFGATQQSLTVVEIFRRYGNVFFNTSLIGRLVLRGMEYAGNFLGACMCWSFLYAWPRIGTDKVFSVEDLPLFVENRVATLEEAGRIASYSGFKFKPPFTATYIPYGKDRDEGAIVHLAVSHMISDGFCVVPIMDDFAFHVSQEDSSSETDCSDTPCGFSQQRLPTIPSAFSALENRLLQTVVQTCAGPACQAGSVGASDSTISREFFGQRKWRDTLTVLASVPAEVVADIRHAARYLSVPDDIAILTIIGITLAKFHGRKRELISMIVPQRDGPSENDMVGLFADARTLTVATEGLNFLGVALRLQHIVKERLWCAPGVATQFDMTFVNFEWTDFDARHGFTQRITHGEHGEPSFYPLRVAVDQPTRDAWRMRVVFCRRVYNETRINKFFDDFQTSLHGLLRTPLAPVWPSSSEQH